MPSPQTLLPLLLGGVIGAAGIFQGLHWRSASTPGEVSVLQSQLRLASEENEMLKRENDSLRSLAQGGGEIPVPQELIDRAEKEFGLRFLSSPVVHQVAGEELGDRISAATESRFGPSGILDRQDAYLLIGWLRPDDELLAQLAAVRSVGARGWFDDVTGEGWVTNRFDLKNIPDQAALVRILVRVLLHQNFPPPPAYPGDDAARAREALHQGAASGSEARFYAANARAIGFVPMVENTAAGHLLATLSPFIQGLTTFPLIEGKGLADMLHIQGNEPFQKAFRSPPQTTRAIQYPAEPAAEPEALKLPVTPEEPFLTESAGMLGVRLWVEPLGDAGVALEISSSWKNDRYVLFPNGEASSAVLWDIELSDPAAADKLQSVALDLAAVMSGREEAATLGKVSASPAGRHLLVVRPSPNRVRFLNTADAATADALGKAAF